MELEVEKESKSKLRMMFFSAVTIRSQYLSILEVDGVLSVVSLILVWAYMWWTLESIFLASVAMFEIVFSIPVAFFVWTVILQQKIDFFQVRGCLDSSLFVPFSERAPHLGSTFGPLGPCNERLHISRFRRDLLGFAHFSGIPEARGFRGGHGPGVP